MAQVSVRADLLDAIQKIRTTRWRGLLCWLCVVSLLCTAVEALADFEFDGNGLQRFAGFVERYFSPDFSAGVLSLDDPMPDRGAPAVTPAQHLYNTFGAG